MAQKTKATLAGLVGYGIFGFSFLFSKIALESASTFTLLSLRFLTAFAALNVVLLTGKVKLSLMGKPVGRLLLLGLVQPVIYFVCETYGIGLTTSSFSGVMIGLAPVMGLILGVIFMKERCTVFRGVCTVLSVVGVAMTSAGGGLGEFSLPGFCFLFAAVTSGSTFVLLSRSLSEVFSPFERTYVMFALGSVVFTVIALFQNRGDLSAWTAPLTSGNFWGAVLYLAVVSSVCAFMLINYAVNYISAGSALIFSNFTTVISVLAGILIMGDRFTPLQLVGIVIIVFSVFGVSMQSDGT